MIGQQKPFVQLIVYCTSFYFEKATKYYKLQHEGVLLGTKFTILKKKKYC